MFGVNGNSGLLNNCSISAFMNNPEINVLVTGLVATLGSDPTEQACESQCITMVHADNVLHHLCPFVCHS